VSRIPHRRRRLAKLRLGDTVYSVEAPGLKVVQRPLKITADLYWTAADDAVNNGYLTKTVRIHLKPGATDEEIIAQVVAVCRAQQNAMLAWLDGEDDDKERLAPKFDGTIGSLAECYESDDDSAYQELKANSAEGYKPWLKMVRKTVGARLIFKVVAKDLRRWYRNWKEISTTRGTDGTRQAYGGIQIIRILLKYGAESGIEKCRQLREDIEGMRFPRNPPRTATMSYEQVRAFIAKAFEMDAPFMALDQALQFEGMFRQNDVRGQWRKAKRNEVPNDGEIRVGDRIWRGITMDMLSIGIGMELLVKTSKTGQPVVHDVDSCELVVECLRKIDVKHGPVARQANDLPWPDRQSYSKAWRVIAKAAGIPKTVWNMDSRASGISEASDAGVSDDDITKQAGNSKGVMKRVYNRKGRGASVRSHSARQAHRRKDSNSSNVAEE
jgi:hypothetical protein